MVEEATAIRPHHGPQERFLACGADVALYGGAAGGGKTWGILNDPLRWVGVEGFDAVIFRRTMPMITRAGGLWQESFDTYDMANGRPREYDHTWRFPANSSIAFSHMQHEKNRIDWQGSQLAFIGWDELTHFTRAQFLYMLSRNRSTCGVRPYIRATCNPDPDSWALELVAWYLDEDGFVDPERDGITRWFARKGENLEWANNSKELTKLGLEPKSFCFISAKLEDNPTLAEGDPGYRANLKALPSWERKQLLEGNWYAKAVAGDVFQRSWFQVVRESPGGGRVVRHWDRAATKPSEVNQDPDWTVGLKLRETHGKWWVEDVERFRESPGEVRRRIKATASQDGYDCEISIEVEPGSSGKADADDIARLLAGYRVKGNRATGSKVDRAGGVSAQAEFGNVMLVRGLWNRSFLDELVGFPGSGHDDQVDGLSGSFNHLRHGGTPSVDFA